MDSVDVRRVSRGWAVVAGAVVALFVGVLYLGTLAPTVLPYGVPDTLDSPMLQAAVPTLGIGHPTGYPTYMMLTHLFTYLPFGDVAYRVNLASAVYGVGAVSAVYVAGLLLARRILAAAAGALAFGVSGAFWSEAGIAEVYTLAALFLAAVMCALLLWRDRRNDRFLLLGAFLTGLSLTHHLSSVFVVPAGLAFVYLTDRGVYARTGLLLRGLGLFALGLLPLLYLPVRAVMDAPLNEADPSTPGRFLTLVTGGSFLAESSEAGRECSPSALAQAGAADKLALFGREVLDQYPAVFLVLAALTLVYLLYADRAAAALLGTVVAGSVAHGLVYVWLGIEDFAAFLIPALLALALCASAGLGLLLRFTERSRPNPGRVLILALSVLLLALPFLSARTGYEQHDRSGDLEGRRAVAAVARNAERGATILHHRSPLWYMVLGEERRRDLTLVDPFCTSWNRQTDLVWPGNLSAPQSAARHGTDDTTGVEAARKAAERGPVYLLDHDRVDYDRFREAGFDPVPLGGDSPLYRLTPRANPRRKPHGTRRRLDA